ncbi:hypothetical protein GOD37_22655 [Sinorhizobium medicae]|nr:hypothetical protein [Sinorhizobium medicae]
MNEELDRRKNISFLQAEGLVPLPRQLALGELPKSTKVKLWATLHDAINRYTLEPRFLVHETLKRVALKWWVEEAHQMADEFKSDSRWVKERWKGFFGEETPYYITLNLVQFFLRNFHDPKLRMDLTNILEKEMTAYRVICQNTIMPITSPEEGEAVVQALEITARSGIGGARQHLIDAAANLSSGKFAESVRESISAVEAVACASTGEKSFATAIGVMNGRRPMNGAFKTAINRLYDYTSQQPGIRHAKQQDSTADVSERDAVFMLPVCAAFITYVLAEERTG